MSEPAKNKFIKRHSIILMLAIMILLLLSSLFSPLQWNSRWDLIKKRGELLYGTRTSLLTYFATTDGIIGYEYQLLKAFADQHGLELKATVYESNKDLFDDLRSGQLDIAGGHLSVTPNRQKEFSFSQAFNQTEVQLVTHIEHRNFDDIKSFEPLRGVVIHNSSYEELIQSLPDFEPLHLETTDDFSLFELVRNINSKEIDYTLGDSEILNIYQYFVPGIYPIMNLSEPKDTAFMMNPDRSGELKQELDEFIVNARESGLLTELMQEVFLHIPDIDPANTVTFFDKLQTSWPLISDLVFEVAADYDFDPALLAAISYQESHWDADAVSFSGVRGLMMLTEITATEMAVEDRTDPRQSLEGGIRYFRYMKSRIPDRITEPDRTLFALAAYNVGYGHLEDARILTQRAGKNPDDWFDVAAHLSKLNNPKMTTQLKYGNADGKTAVTYVNNIMTYKQLMTWKFNKEQRTVADSKINL